MTELLQLNLGFHRKVIRVRALDSPNVREALKELAQRSPQERAQGKEPSDKVVVPGVLSWGDYQRALATWDVVRQCVGLQGEFYQGAEELLFPSAWLERAETLARELRSRPEWGVAGEEALSKAYAIGIDSAEGGDSTVFVAVNHLGVVDLIAMKTHDTSVIVGQAIAFMLKHRVPASRVAFDRGGGGKQHADQLRAKGYDVRTVAFGESVTREPKRTFGKERYTDRRELAEDKYVYFNRRAEMYGELSLLLDPSVNPNGFAIPAEWPEIRKQLAPIPRRYDSEGRLVLLPKNKRDPGSKEKTLVELIGHSPDEADALVLACHAMLHEPKAIVAGAAI